VTWVNLTEDVSRAIAAQLDGASGSTSPSSPPAETIEVVDASDGRTVARISIAPGSGSLIVQTRLTEGNIRNSHFYLRGCVDRFPSELVGGSNKTERAVKQAVIDWGGPSHAVTDIDGDKQIFRERGWTKQFFEVNEAQAGNWVLIEEAGPYRYRVSLKKA
jgi:hypothetical protein